MGGHRHLLAAAAAVGCGAAIGAATVSHAAEPTSSVPSIGKIVFVCGAMFDKLCVAAAGARVRGLAPLAARPGGAYETPSLSRDGRHLAFVYLGRAYAANGDGTGARLLAADRVAAVAVRPDGKAVLLLRDVALCEPPRPQCNLHGYVSQVVTWGGASLARVSTPVASATWLNDQRLVAISARDRSMLITLPLRGCCERLIRRDPKWHFNGLAVAPDRTMIAASAVALAGAASPVFLVRVDGTKMTRLTASDPRGDSEFITPAWSPDGRSLAVGVAPGGPLFVTDITPGSKLRRVALRGIAPTWSFAP